MESAVLSDEVQSQLPELLDRVERGESITILRDGRPVARLVPTPAEATRRDLRMNIEAMKRFQEESGPVLGPNVTVRNLIEEGRRW